MKIQPLTQIKSSPNLSLKSFNKQILIIEDNVRHQKALHCLLNHLGDLTVVSCGNDAIRELKNNEYDLIVSDQVMDNGNGLDVVNFINEKGINTPIIIQTGSADKDLVISALNKNVFAFVEKTSLFKDLEDLATKGLIKNEKDRANTILVKVGESAGQLIHDLVNPLTLIDFSVQSIQDHADKINDSYLIDKSKKMNKYSARIKDLVLSTKDSMRNNLRLVKKDIFLFSYILAEVDSAYSLLLKNNQNIKIKINTSGQDFKMFGGKDDMLRVFINLINNSIHAIKHLENQWVSIDLEILGKTAIVNVTDSGNGIPPVYADKIFDKLFSTKESEGNGLGLNIVKEIVIDHGGEITINNKCANTQFQLKLPISDKDLSSQNK